MASAEDDASTPRRASRLLALDWFRFLAVALMVQGHTFYEVLVRAVKDAPWYAWHGYVHGFTAPMFYFSSGLAFGLTTARGWNHHLHWGPALRKRFERYVILLLIGYAMQAGDFSFRTLLHATPAERMPLLAVNTLQNIGATLFLAELLVIICRKPAIYRTVLVVVTCFVVLFAPWAWRLDVSSMPTFFAAYLTDATGSLFPIFPWSGYALAGILVSLGLLGLDGRSMRAHPARWLLGLGLGLAVVGKLGGLSGFAPWGEHNYWKTSPWFFLQRLGVIVLVFSALAYVEKRLRPSPDEPVLRFVQTVAQETLVIYVGHLLLLYGTPWTVEGLHELYPETLSLGGSILAFVCVLLPMLVLAYYWHRMKTERGALFDRIRWAVTAVLIAIYLLNPGTHPDQTFGVRVGAVVLPGPGPDPEAAGTPPGALRSSRFPSRCRERREAAARHEPVACMGTVPPRGWRRRDPLELGRPGQRSRRLNLGPSAGPHGAVAVG